MICPIFAKLDLLQKKNPLDDWSTTQHDLTYKCSFTQGHEHRKLSFFFLFTCQRFYTLEKYYFNCSMMYTHKKKMIPKTSFLVIEHILI